MPSARRPAKKAAKAPARARRAAAPTKKAAAARSTKSAGAKPAKKAAAKRSGSGSKATASKRSSTAKKAANAKKAAPAKKAASKGSVKRKRPAKKAAAKAKAKAPAAKKAKAATTPKAAAPRKPPRKRSKQVTCPLSGLTVTPGTPRLAAGTLTRLRTLLEEERARHLHQAEELQAEAEELMHERDQGDTQFDEESGEGDTVSVERERSLLLSASARHAVEEIDRALDRMDAGTYGVCVPAGRPVNLARLEAIPWAETCVECAQRVARRR